MASEDLGTALAEKPSRKVLLALARYVAKLTLHPGDIVLADIDALRAAGFDDLDILDANNQCAHLNYTNRVANGLGLLTEVAVDERSRNRIPT